MKPYLKYGLIVAATGILISMITYVLGFDKTDAGQYIGYLNLPIIIVAMVMAMKEKRTNELGGFIEFGQAFSTGAMLVVVSTVITSIYTYFYMSIINPGLHDYIVQKELAKMEAKGQSQEQIDMAMPYIEKFTTPAISSVFILIFGIILGIVIALIVAAIVKKPNPNPLDAPVS